MRTFLFDLDGTLLPMDMEQFERIYFTELSKSFVDMVDPKEFTNIVWSATKSMVLNTEHRTNEEVFMEHFGSMVGDSLPEYQKRFDTFYDTDYFKVKDSIKDVTAIKDSIKLLKEKGYDIIIATNPLFPEKAIVQRIRWAGFEPEDFSYYSHFEKNHYCKPQIKYYEEVLAHTNKTAEDCIMVGNDVQEDLIAKKLGMKTYLITDNMLHRTDDEFITDYKGDYLEFYEFVKSLPFIK